MEITEVRVKLVENAAERLLAFCSITINAAFVVRDLKIIGGPNGPFVAMPSRKLCSHCQGCGYKNPFKASYCNQCGAKLADNRLPCDAEGRPRIYADIAHPLNANCRDIIQTSVVHEYNAEILRSQVPGHESRYECIGDEEHRH